MTKKKIAAVILLVVMLFALGACGSSASRYEGIELDPEAMAAYMYENGSYEDELVRLNDELIALNYAMGGVKTVVYAGSGATAEEIIVIEAGTEKDVKGIDSAIGDYIQKRIQYFDGYNADELPKLDNPLRMSAGRYVIYCVSCDTDGLKTQVTAYLDQLIKE